MSSRVRYRGRMKLGPWAASASITVLVLRGLAACYSPAAASGAPCDTTTNMCPEEQRCVATSGTQGVCTGSGREPDAGAGSDAQKTGYCLGAHLAGLVCIDTQPTNAVTLNTSLSTDSVAAGNCTELHDQGGQKYCLIAGDTITIPAGTTVHAVGANPLVLMAAHTITVQGTIDVSSHVGESVGGVPVAGAAGRKATDCVAVGIDGSQGSGSNGSGGGGGGSFGTLGAAGGTGRNNTPSGKPATPAAPATLVGGCPGGAGGNGSGNMGGSGPGGFGGGVVYLLAGGSIQVSGSINASGAGGGGGTAGEASSGGGGGGGAGGLIGIESPATTISSAVFANGGGGGGGGDANGNGGNAGATPTVIGTAGGGGSGANQGGGDGGAGATATAAKAGGNAGNSNLGPQAAGGGGGGGLGVIKVYGTPTTTGATFSPPLSST